MPPSPHSALKGNVGIAPLVASRTSTRHGPFTADGILSADQVRRCAAPTAGSILNTSLSERTHAHRASPSTLVSSEKQ